MARGVAPVQRVAGCARSRGRSRTCPTRRSRDRARHTHPSGLSQARHSAGRPTSARLYSAAISSLHTRYASSHQRCTLSSGSSRIAGDRPVPHIVTELPGPKARAHVAFDETWTSPSLPRAYPIVPVRGDGLAVEDIDGNLFLDFAAGIAVNSTGHSHPQVVAAIKEQAAELIHFSASRLLPADLPRGLPRAGAHRADLRPRPGLPRQLRDRGRRGVDQARPVRDQAAVHRRLPRRLPRSDLRLGLADRVEGEVPRRLRAAAARRLPRAVRAGRGPRAGSTRSCSTSSPRPTRSRRSSSSRSRARAATSSPRTASSRACATSATSTASC